MPDLGDYHAFISTTGGGGGGGGGGRSSGSGNNGGGGMGCAYAILTFVAFMVLALIISK